MRHARPTTEQTKQALDKIVKQVASEMDVSDDYLYAILAGFKADYYAHFRAMFRAVARVDPHRSAIWLSDLAATQKHEESKQQTDAGRAFNKFVDESAEFIKAASCPKTPAAIKRKEALDVGEAINEYAGCVDPDGEEEDAAVFGGPRGLKAS